MYPTRLYHILMYGGALLIILGIICIIYLILLMYKRHRMISAGTRAIQYVGSSMMIPLLSLLGIFRDGIKKPTKPTKPKTDM